LALLSTRYQLFDLEDVEDVCTKKARAFAQQNCGHLPEQDFEGLVAFLIEAVWRMSTRYDPELSTSFEAIVRNRLGNRCVDWLRLYAGRTRWQFGTHTYEGPSKLAVLAVSLDAASGPDGDQLAERVGRTDAALDALSDPDIFGGLLLDREAEAPFDVPLVRALARRLILEQKAALVAARAA
jgi:hypothetical protein